MMRTFLPVALTASLALAGCGRKPNTFVATGPWSETADAELALDAALARATVEDKVVFVHFSAPG